MRSVLEAIAADKRQEVEHLPFIPASEGVPGRFLAALSRPGMSLIGQIMRKAPVAGELSHMPDPMAQVALYQGAHALSVLTDAPRFGGSFEDLSMVSQDGRPVLMKDFVVSKRQIDLGVVSGAAAVLLIAAVLKEQLTEFVQYALAVGIDPLVEVINEEEIELAVAARTPAIAVNNRNLHTLEVDLSRSAKLLPHIPRDVLSVAASGIQTVDDALLMRGYDALLVGEALMRQKEPSQLIGRILDAC